MIKIKYVEGCNYLRFRQRKAVPASLLLRVRNRKISEKDSHIATFVVQKQVLGAFRLHKYHIKTITKNRGKQRYTLSQFASN
ncbi:MAG TPA: hypothetical protein DCM62_01850 [Bacteroidales bacterium]|nr:hypothetical protein [Bacteroidales bacterium]